MKVYLNSKLVESSFRRLAPRDNTGKKHKERTSALLYFLAFDAAAKKLSCNPLDVNPKTTNGKNNRDAMTLEFAKFVLLQPASDSSIRQVSALGGVEIGGNDPDKRISSNFFTVPVKKASESAKACNYPNRPAAPLLKMGANATGIKWGISYHDNWDTNLPKLTTEMKGGTPFTDIAIFILRNDALPKGHDVQESLLCALQARFSKELVEFWSCRMNSERILFKHGKDPYCDNRQDSLTESAFSAVGGTSDREALQSLDKATLIDKVVCLEGLLAAHDIDY